MCDHYSDQVAGIMRLDENALKQSAPFSLPHLPFSELPLLSLSISVPIGVCSSSSLPDPGLTLGRVCFLFLLCS